MLQATVVCLEGVACRQIVEDVDRKVAGPMRFVLPALVNDGARDTEVTMSDAAMTLRRVGGMMRVELAEPKGAALELTGPKVPNHNGYVRAAVGALPDGSREAAWKIKLEPAPLK